MMMTSMNEDNILIGKEFDKIRQCAIGSESVTIVSPFITNSALEQLVPESSDNVRILTCWRPDLVISGFSDLELYTLCKDRGWRLYNNPKLHAKIYIFDKTVFLGSANCTFTGLGISSNPNIEAMIKVQRDENSMESIERIFSESILVDDNYYNQWKKWFIKQPKYNPPEYQGFVIINDEKSISNLPNSSNPEDLWVQTFEMNDVDGDIEKYHLNPHTKDYDEFKRTMRSVFDNIGLIRDFLSFIESSDDGRRFGESKYWLKEHSSDCNSNDNAIKFTKMLYNWIPEIYPEYQIKQPNYTHVIYKVHK